MNASVAKALCTCLSLADNAADVEVEARQAGWAAIVESAVQLRLGPALVSRLRDKGAVPPIPAVTLPNGLLTITASLDGIWRDHLHRRKVMAEWLAELVGALNAVGIEPILMKGARSLASGQPAWRSMRDLDLLVPGDAAERAQGIALSLGYQRSTGATEKAGKHHFQPLFRDDLPGWLEIHRKAAPYRAEGFVPTSLLASTSVPITLGEARARAFDGPGHTLHAIVHHHVGHRGDKGGGIDLKGLFEFAADAMAMNDDERGRTVALATRHPRLLAMLDLWVAAAHLAFGMPVIATLGLEPDARERAIRALTLAASPGGRYAGVLEEIRFATAPPRLARQPGGSSLVGRQRLRFVTIGSMLKPMIDPTGD